MKGLEKLGYELKGPTVQEYLFVKEHNDGKGFIDYEVIRINISEGTFSKTMIVERDSEKGVGGTLYRTGGDVTVEELRAINSILESHEFTVFVTRYNSLEDLM